MVQTFLVMVKKGVVTSESINGIELKEVGWGCSKTG